MLVDGRSRGDPEAAVKLRDFAEPGVAGAVMFFGCQVIRAKEGPDSDGDVRRASLIVLGPECRRGGVRFTRSDRAAGVFRPQSALDRGAGRQRTESGRAQSPACSGVSVANAVEMVEVAPVHSPGRSNRSIISVDAHRNDKDGTHRHAPRAAGGKAGRWG